MFIINTLKWCALFICTASSFQLQAHKQIRNELNHLDTYTGITFKINAKYDLNFKKGEISVSRNELNSEHILSDSPYLEQVELLHPNYKPDAIQVDLSGLNIRRPKLENWLYIPVTPSLTNAEILEIYNALVSNKLVSHVDLETAVQSLELKGINYCALNEAQCKPEPCTDDKAECSPTPLPTPDLQFHQAYLNNSPYGIDALHAWSLNARGQGIRIIDMENGFNERHEDLPTTFVRANDNSNGDHGTAVMSVLGAKNDGQGVTGIAHNSQLGFYGWGVNASRSIREAAARLRAGDVLLLEGQISRGNLGDRCNDRSQAECVPMEWIQANFEAIQDAVWRGVIVVEAAGNGNEDLDNAVYRGLFNRNVRDSGAFLIAATRRNIDIIRSGFSNHGTRIDFNAWGNSVAAAGLYGRTLFNGGFNRRYGDGFSGTSSASPIVAGAVALLQSHAVNRMGRRLNVAQVRETLAKTGVQGPQNAGVGVRPALRQALDAIR
jgi:hypothetical protein